MTVTTLPEPSRDELRLTDVMRALSDPIRVRLLDELADGAEHRCHALNEGIDVHKSTMSHHYRTLRECGLTTTRQIGRERYVHLRRDDLDARFPGLLDAVLDAARAMAAETS